MDRTQDYFMALGLVNYIGGVYQRDLTLPDRDQSDHQAAKDICTGCRSFLTPGC